MPEISIITPVYQAENFLKKCVDSILSQSFTDWELLLIDDGSIDKSSEICRAYEKQDPRIRYHRKENGGVSSARNMGVELAEGNYLTFVDCDDYVEPDLLETLDTLVKKYDADLGVCRNFDYYEGKKKPVQDRPVEDFCTDTKEGLRQVFQARVFGVGPVSKLYRREIFKGVVYPEKTIAEDAYVIVPLMKNCKKIAFSTAQKYYYMHRKASLTTSQFRWSDMGSVEVWDHNADVIRKEYPELMENARARCSWARFFVLDKLMLLEHPGTKEKKLIRRLVRELKKDPAVVLFGDHFTKGRKAAYLFLFTGTGIYRRFIRQLYRKRNL